MSGNVDCVIISSYDTFGNDYFCVIGSAAIGYGAIGHLMRFGAVGLIPDDLQDLPESVDRIHIVSVVNEDITC